jgi:predicted MFS family arabinose efflux permease
MAPNKTAFARVTGGYLAASTGESLLAPLFPVVGRDLGLGTGSAGLAFATLAVSIAVGGLAGGLVLARRGPRIGTVGALLLVAAGAATSAAADGEPVFLLGQAVLGFGSGSFFASGLTAVAALAGDRRRGMAMGIFGIAFSGGLALAGGVAALGDAWGWRSSFLFAAGLALASAATIAPLRLPARATREARGAPSRARNQSRREALAIPVSVGGVAAACQYGTVAFLPLFAVHEWGLSPAAAALMITVARILSIPAKLVSGNAADGAGAVRIARRLGLLLAVLGAWWTIAPGQASAGVWAAVLFAAFVSGLGPVANVLALEGFAEHAELLGAFRSAQIGLGAATDALIGLTAGLVGLRPALAVAAVLIPGSLLLVGRNAQAGRESLKSPS